jgi:hypothetical protein
MAETTVKFPVVCPACGNEKVGKYPIGHIAEALMHGRPIRLYSACHGKYWDANDEELQQIFRAALLVERGVECR